MAEKRDQVDFVTLFEAHFSYVWSILRRLGTRQEDTEDLTHEVFLKVYRRIEELDPTRPVRPWLFAFAYRVASEERRRARHRREVISGDLRAPDPAESAEVQLAKHEERSLLLDALEDLDLERRAVLVLHEWDGESIPEVARALDIPLNTAYSRLRLAREDLARAVHRRIPHRRRA